MGTVAQRREKPHVLKGQTLPDQGIENAGTDQRADRDKKHRVCELPMVFQRQQGVGIGLDQHIQIRRHARERADPERMAQGAGLATRLCGGSANRCLTEGIHSRSVVELPPK
ncbi:MAG: Uncharacterised protein [Halieaceae bacterium]|nr:MAG: Uncharacterised protein [Halieaceae bacterium]